MFSTPEQAASVLMWIAACGLAVWRGALPERIAASVMMANVLMVAALPGLDSVGGVKWGPFVSDMLLLATFATLLTRYTRRWLIIALGFQLASVLAHLPRMVDSTIRNWGYATVIVAAGYGVLAALLYGALWEARRNGGA